MGLLFRFCICPVRDQFERYPLPPLLAPLPAPLPPPLPYADFTGLGLTSDMFFDACGCFDLNQLVRLCSAWNQLCVLIDRVWIISVVRLFSAWISRTLLSISWMKCKHNYYTMLESTNTAPSSLRYDISMKCTVITYHLAWIRCHWI